MHLVAIDFMPLGRGGQFAEADRSRQADAP
jgi:hypothetical protein